MTEESKNPLEIRCSACGAPAEFDIIHQIYQCRYCGQKVDANEPVERLKKWRALKRRHSGVNSGDIHPSVHICKNCGAEILIPEGEAVGRCEFCGGNLVRRAFTFRDNLPEVFIPFVLTEREASERLTAWALKNKRIKEAGWVEKNIKSLKGYYLPYQIVKGPVRCTVFRDQAFSDKKYICGSFINGMAVNTSNQLDNMVLDHAEPFDWKGTVPFEFGYIAGQRVKLPDISGGAAEQRVLEEVEADYLPIVEKVMETSGVKLHAKGENLLSIPALLPLYIIAGKGKLAAVNGQTGRIAVSVGEKKKSWPWIVEPLLMTVFVFIVMLFLFDYEVYVAGMVGLVFGIIFFAGFSDGRSARIRKIIRQGKNCRAERKGIRLIVKEEAFPEKDFEAPVFFEKVKGKMAPVKISFYSWERWIQIGVFLLLLNFLPAVFALLIYYGSGMTGPICWSAMVVWLCLSVPCSLILWMSVGRIRLYNYPLVKLIGPEGKLTSVQADDIEPMNLFYILKDITELLLVFPWVIALLVFIILGTVGAMLM